GIGRKAIQSPVRQIAENAGTDGSIVVGKLTDKGDPNFGYDARSGEHKDMVAAGIIYPTKVVRVALQDATSVAGLLITTEGMVADRPEPKGAAGMPPGGAAWITRRPAAPAQGKGHRLSLKTGDAIALTTFCPGPAAGAACGFSRQREGRHGRAGTPPLNSGDVRIDYQMTGSGPLDLVFVPGFVSSMCGG